MNRIYLALCLGVLLFGSAAAGRLSQDQNAATLYRQALTAAALDGVDDTQLAPILAKGWKNPPADVSRWLDANKASLDALRQGSKRSRCQFVPEVGVIGKTELPDYTKLAALTRLLMVDGLRQYAAGDADGALNSMMAALRVSLHMQQDGVVVARSVGLQMQEAAFIELLGWLQTEKIPAAVLQRGIPQAESARLLMTPLAYSVDVERQWTEATVDDLAHKKSGDPGDIMEDLTPAQKAEVAAEYRKLAEPLFADMKHHVAMLDFAGLYKVEASVVKQANVTHSPHAPSEYARALAARLVPVFTSLVPGYGIGQVELEGLPSLLALKAYQTSHHSYPPTLAKLVPGLIKKAPHDPYGSGDMHYKMTAHGALLYSVGPDGKDDGGKHPLKDYAQLKGADIVFTLP